MIATGWSESGCVTPEISLSNEWTLLHSLACQHQYGHDVFLIFVCEVGLGLLCIHLFALAVGLACKQKVVHVSDYTSAHINTSDLMPMREYKRVGVH